MEMRLRKELNYSLVSFIQHYPDFFPTYKSITEMGQKATKDAICGMSDPAHPHTLVTVDDGNPPSGCYVCDGAFPSERADRYRCTNCDVEFHYGCRFRMRRIWHPYHLQHPLTLAYVSNETVERLGQSQVDIMFKECHWCGGDLGKSFYYCFICSFVLDECCAAKRPLLTITTPKSHHHPLLFLPRPLSLPCDGCGLVNREEPSYTCFQCNYMVHLSCIDLPRVIKITRHCHRLSHTPYRPPAISPCRICYKTVDLKYGKYSCSHEECSYLVHSKCATHEKIWSGSELEWKPEQLNRAEDRESFKTVGADVIKHLCHEHNLKLAKYDNVRDADKQCRACINPIDFRHGFYSCIQCDFYLHELCAKLPRILEHALHHHPLLLEFSPKNEYTMDCSACFRKFSGFWYRCSETNCENRRRAMIDVRCILIPDYFTHKCHMHPIFISTVFDSHGEVLCKVCKAKCLDSYLQCTVCKFSLCYGCATIPDEVEYKYDEHPLSLCYGEEADNTYWCEVCEKILDPTEWFYTCDKCCTTVHRKCINGPSVYMRYGYEFHRDTTSLKVVRNSSNSRPKCSSCYTRCVDSVYYESCHKNIYCSIHCVKPRVRSEEKFDTLRTKLESVFRGTKEL